MLISRRNLFGTLATAAATAQLIKAADEPPGAITGKRPMILHNDRPEDLDSTPVRYFDGAPGSPPSKCVLCAPAPAAARADR